MRFAGDSTKEQALQALMMESVSHDWFHNNVRIEEHKRRASHAAARSATEPAFAAPSSQCAALDD